MAVRQYIGARYVPRFYENSLGTAEWQPNVAYEPLTIVTYNGNSYTSKKDVPANIGDPSNNPTYWASTGIYNQQIDEYREETAQALATANHALDVFNMLGLPTDTSYAKILFVGTGTEYATINAAVTEARRHATRTNRIAIFVFGNGNQTVYNESIDLNGVDGIDFYGIGGRPIVRSSVAWREATLRTDRTIYVSNMRFENYYTPTGSEHAGYALHNDPVEYIQIFKDCYFFADNAAAAGTGMSNGGRVYYINCYFRGTSGLYCHNKQTGATDQVIHIEECEFEAFSGGKSISVDDAASLNQTAVASPMWIYARGNTCTSGIAYRFGNPATSWNYLNNSPSTGNAVALFRSGSGGNNIPALNGIRQHSAYFVINGASTLQTYYIPDADRYNVELLGVTGYSDPALTQRVSMDISEVSISKNENVVSFRLPQKCFGELHLQFTPI